MIPSHPPHEFPSAIARRAWEQGWLKWAILLSASFGAILEVIDTSIVNVAIPDMQGNLGASLEEIGWVSTAYSMANVIVIPLTAWLGHRFGKKNYFIFSLIAFTAASIGCGLSTNLLTLIVMRVFQGLGGGGLLAKAQSILFETFPPEEHAMASAVFGMGVIVGPAIGPALGGWLTDTIGWRWIFFINLPFGIFAVAMTSTFLLHDPPNEGAKNEVVDWLGIFLLATGLGCLQVVLEQGQQEDWFSSTFIVRLALICIVSLVCFVIHELRVEHPAVDLRVLRYGSLTAGSIYSVILGMGLYGAIYAVPVFAQLVLRFTATKTGLLLVPGALASIVGMMLTGKLMAIVDRRILIAAGGLITAGAAFSLSFINPDTGAEQLFWPLIWRGIGSVLMFLPLSVATLGALPKKDVASGSGFFSLTRQLGGSVGIALIGTIVDKMLVVHRSELIYHISDANPAYADRFNSLQGLFSSNSGDPAGAQAQALALIDRAVNIQAGLLSYIDVFHVVAGLFIVSLPLVFFLRGNPKETADIEMAH